MIVYPLIVIFASLTQTLALDDFYHLKACYPWFRAPDLKSGKNNCTLGCSLQMPYSSISQQEVAVCLRDGRTGILCNSDSDCKQFLPTSYCKKAMCLCEEQSADRFYATINSNRAQSALHFCADVRNIHIPLVLFPWKTLMIIFCTLVMTGLLLMTLKWITPIISTIRDLQSSEINQQRRRRNDLLASEAFQNLRTQDVVRVTVPDKPPPYEAAVQLTDFLPTYEEVQKPKNDECNVLNSSPTDPHSDVLNSATVRDQIPSSNLSQEEAKSGTTLHKVPNSEDV